MTTTTVKKFQGLKCLRFRCAGHAQSSTPPEGKEDSSTIATVPQVRRDSESTVVDIRSIPRSRSAAIFLHAGISGKRYPAMADRRELSVSENHMSSGPPEMKYSDRLRREPGPFQEILTLQSGTYGRAVVVRELGHSSGKRFLCLKVMNKNHIIKYRAYAGVLGERAAYMRLAEVEKTAISAFVMDLDAAMQDRANIYFAMSLMSHDLLEECEKDVEWRRSMAKKWVAQMVMGVAFIHEAGIIHRDIKPENVLVDFRGDIRIADFGCAYVHEDGPLRPSVGYASDIRGTVEYMAPEMLDNRHVPKSRRRNYGLAVDYWAIGCILLELVAEKSGTLFSSEDDVLQCKHWNRKLHDGRSYFSAWKLEEHTEAVLEGLINFEPDERFTIKNLVKHPYFRDENRVITLFEPFEVDQWLQPSTTVDLNFDSTQTKRLYAPWVKVPPDSESFEDLGWINPKGIWATMGSQVD